MDRFAKFVDELEKIEEQGGANILEMTSPMCCA